MTAAQKSTKPGKPHPAECPFLSINKRNTYTVKYRATRTAFLKCRTDHTLLLLYSFLWLSILLSPAFRPCTIPHTTRSLVLSHTIFSSEQSQANCATEMVTTLSLPIVQHKPVGCPPDVNSMMTTSRVWNGFSTKSVYHKGIGKFIFTLKMKNGYLA